MPYEYSKTAGLVFKLHGELGDSSSRWTLHVSHVKLNVASDLRTGAILAAEELDRHVRALKFSFSTSGLLRYMGLR